MGKQFEVWRDIVVALWNFVGDVLSVKRLVGRVWCSLRFISGFCLYFDCHILCLRNYLPPFLYPSTLLSVKVDYN